MKSFYILLLLLVPAAALRAAEAPSSPSKPNIICILADDLGYNDLGCFGSPNIATPRLDRLATEGLRLTDFYAQTVCGPSRAAFMTGCYPLRVAIEKNRVEVHPHLHTQEITLAEMLHDAGYATAAFGKWDLAGHSQTDFESSLLPCQQGFDIFFGTPSSNDVFVNLLRNNEMIEKKADLSTLTRRYTDEAIDFIRAPKEKPFFVYMAHSMPHIQLAASANFKGKSKQGLFGDAVAEVDWNLGRIIDTLKELHLEQNTYLIFTSDNGPWIDPPGEERKPAQGGNAEPLRGGKCSTWEGGLRVPCLVWGPGRVPAGATCREVASTLDILPTLAKLSGGEIPTDRVLDGHDIAPLWHGEKGAVSPTKAFYYYCQNHLQAVRSGNWKLVLPRPAQPPWLLNNWNRFLKPNDVQLIEKPLLFALDSDMGEQHDVAAEHANVVKQLLELAEWARNDIGDYDRIGKNARFFDPQPRRPEVAKWAKLQAAPAPESPQPQNTP